MGKQKYWSSRRLKPNNQQPNIHTSFIDHHPHESSSSSTSAGCMCAVFQLFDFHPLNQHHHHQPSQSSSHVSLNSISLPLPPHDHHHTSAGTEAPRNSLESNEEEEEESTPPKLQKDHDQEGSLQHFPKGIVKIKTKSNGIMKVSSSSSPKENNSGNSPISSCKTPTLVARLMGLDLLPQSNGGSPSTTPRTAPSSSFNLQKSKSSGNNNNNNLMGSRSLPETPRSSCERKSNVEKENYHHRLSLQIRPNWDKENPNHYAKEIVKQIKENVSRKAVGLNDITNYTRRDRDVILLQTKPKISSSSVSPKMKLVLEPPPKKLINPAKVENVKEKKQIKKVKTKVAGLKNNNKQEEPFVVPSSRITKCTAIESNSLKKTPLTNQILSFGSLPTILLTKKDSSFSSPIKPTIPFQSPCNRNHEGADETCDKESNRNLQSSNHQPHIPIIRHRHVIQLPQININNNNTNYKDPKHHITIATTAATAVDGSNCHDITAELGYVRQILLRRTPSISLYSSSVILENYANVSIPNKKLLCHLVEELLKPYAEIMPYRLPLAAERWPEVVEKLCQRVKKLPRAKCEVLEDIDGIIEKDLDILGIGFEDESEEMVKEIEKWIVEELLNETVRFFEEVQDGVV